MGLHLQPPQSHVNHHSHHLHHLHRRVRLARPHWYGRRTPKQWLLVVAPHVCLLLLNVVYLALGVFIFMHIDEELAQRSIYELLLFEFTTLSTIGFGNIVPTNTASRVFCMVYCTFGIPLTLLTTANIGKHCTKLIWLLLTINNKKKRAYVEHRPLPLSIVVLLFGATIAGGFFFVAHSSDEQTGVDFIYFSFVSFTTIGFGDIYPDTDEPKAALFALVYLVWGVVLASTLVSILATYLHKIHYFGRHMYDTRHTVVWIGGQAIALPALFSLVAVQLKTSPDRVGRALRELDRIFFDLDETDTSTDDDEEEGRGGRVSCARKRSALRALARLDTEDATVALVENDATMAAVVQNILACAVESPRTLPQLSSSSSSSSAGSPVAASNQTRLPLSSDRFQQQHQTAFKSARRGSI